MKTIFACIIAALFLLPMVNAASVTRTITPLTVTPGGTVTVTLSVDVSGAPDYYAIDEMYPSGFTVLDKGTGSIEHSGHWKYVIIENAQNTQFTFTLQAPQQEGSYKFTGEYMFGGMTDEVKIAGQDTVVVSASSGADMTWLLVAFLVVIVAVVAVFLIKIKK